MIILQMTYRYLKCSLTRFFCRNISFKLMFSDRFASQLGSHLHSCSDCKSRVVHAFHCRITRIFSDDTVNIHRSSRHALHLLSSKITSPSMAEHCVQHLYWKMETPLSRGVSFAFPSYSNGGDTKSALWEWLIC